MRQHELFLKVRLLYYYREGRRCPGWQGGLRGYFDSIARKEMPRHIQYEHEAGEAAERIEQVLLAKINARYEQEKVEVEEADKKQVDKELVQGIVIELKEVHRLIRSKYYGQCQKADAADEVYGYTRQFAFVDRHYEDKS